jgi:cell division protein FtsI/penicillin-binding protein 2
MVELALANDRGDVTVMKVPSGEILAMASEPSSDINLCNFCPNHFRRSLAKSGDPSILFPGSMFKWIFSIAFLEPEEVLRQDSFLLRGNEGRPSKIYM